MKEVNDQSELPIAETFSSIQGEGKLVGTPSFFIRVSGCNLRCTWCDTPYASWSPEGQQRSVSSLIDEAVASGLKHIVLTGGEPMIFDPITPLCNSLHKRGLHVTIETAGTVHRAVACDLMSISPKLANSTPTEHDPRDPGGTWRRRHEARRLNIDALQRLIDDARGAGRAFQLKFVVTGQEDVTEIDSLLDALDNWSNHDVLLMPEGVTPPSQEQCAWIVRVCTQRGWRFCRRLHIDLFGNVRGT
ncbi:MAG: 7-carboxy-7-deazaguanine synthase QueE [Planctomycetes bacterium]|nr:7-carboxy-7-deazaguanine synthase QueE [Planctomycetota bacterium]